MNSFLLKGFYMNFVKKGKYLLSKSVIKSDYNLQWIDKNRILFLNYKKYIKKNLVEIKYMSLWLRRNESIECELK